MRTDSRIAQYEKRNLWGNNKYLYVVLFFKRLPVAIELKEKRA